jgi:hypothetical protein
VTTPTNRGCDRTHSCRGECRGAFRHRNGARAFGAWSRRNEEERAIREGHAGSTSDIFRHSAGERTSRAQEAADKEKEEADGETLSLGLSVLEIGDGEFKLLDEVRACGPSSGSVAKGMKKIGYRFPPEIIQQAIWLLSPVYTEFSRRRRIIDRTRHHGPCEVWRWVNHFGPMVAADLRKRGNVAGSHTPGNITPETRLPG